MSRHQKMYLKALVLYLLTWIATAAYQPLKQSKTGKGSGSSVIFPVSGNVYPQGYYHVTINFGNPPKPYFLDIDTGSDLTWLQCDAPCVKCFPSPNTLYKPKKKNLIMCVDHICAALHDPEIHRCSGQGEQCDYEVRYADYGSSLGVLVRDSVPLKLTSGSTVVPKVAFGCGYNQEYTENSIPFVDGVLGLGPGSSSILAQLRDMGVTRNVVGHCLSGQNGGFLFFGDDFLPNSGIVWTPLLGQSMHYSLGSANLLFGGLATKIKGLQIVFDSGSTYTYFTSHAYKALVSLIKAHLNGKRLKVADDLALPLCWRGARPFRSIRDVVGYFSPLTLSFTNTNVHFHLSPESYLIVSDNGNVCLGILNGGEVGLEVNVIGDISFQDKLVIYDNERRLVGWAPANCDNLPNS